MPRIFKHLEAGCLQVNLVSTSAQINQLRYTILSSFVVLSGVPQSSVLWLLLFIIYINNIDEGLTNRILKFADDTKLFGVVTNGDDVEKMRIDYATGQRNG